MTRWSLLVFGVLVGIHLALTAFTYWDTGRLPLERRKWTAIVGAIPAYGFIVYLLTRSELSYDPETDPYTDHSINVHPSRADDVPWSSRKAYKDPGVPGDEAERVPAEDQTEKRSDEDWVENGPEE